MVSKNTSGKQQKKRTCAQWCRERPRKIRSWWRDGELNPLFLYIYDKELDAAFQLKLRKVVQFRLKVSVIVIWIYYLFFILRKISEIEKHYYFITIFGSVSLFATIAWLLSLISLRLIDYTSILILLSRWATIFALVRLFGGNGFENNDLKELYGVVEFVMVPCFLVCQTNWKFDLCLTVPLTIVASVYSINVAFTVEDGNMDCYKIGEAFAGLMINRGISTYLILFYAIHDNRRT